MKENPAASQAQLKASDPAATVWVNANAGSGKTHVLVDRVIRLMLGGSEPSRIMCLTFTKAAAAEMANRLFERLGKWVTLDDAALLAELARLGVMRADRQRLALARQLFTRALETPGGLKIQTIHAFCERVLQLFPVEAGVVPHFSMLDERETRAVLAEARNAVLIDARDGKPGALGDALQDVVNRANAGDFDKLLAQLLGKRATLRAILETDDGLGRAEHQLRHLLSLEQGLTREGLVETLRCDAGRYLELAEVLDRGSSTERDRAAEIRKQLSSQSATLLSLCSVLLIKDGSIRQSIANKKTLAAHGWIEDFIKADQARLVDGLGLLGDLECLTATLSLLKLGQAISERFSEAKRARGAYDFDDLIIRTGELLRERPDAAWVLYKLDGGIEHLLVDEAQDTSPMQWQIIRSLTDDFFTGEGRHGTALRTLFVVGDRKQSIYSFQGADPAVFEDVLTDVQRQAEGARQEFRAVDFSVSFRSTPEVLFAVDAVFAERSPARLKLDGNVPRDWHHEPNRRGEPGVVEIWPLEHPGDALEQQPWQAPVDREPTESPRRRLAKRLVRTIKGWIGHRRLSAQNRAVEPGDILILVRQRNSFFDGMIRALWNEGIPVAGADRLKLGENIAVLDLLALVQFTIMPEDDHALACILKSPLFEQPLSEDDLLHLAAGHVPGTLWQRLSHEAKEPYAAAATLLRPLVASAPGARPFEFLVGVLTASRLRFVSRLGSEANDAIDALLDRALDYEELHGTSLAGFVNWFQAEEIEIKRNMDPDAGLVRVMTVHGAKGLEAPIVILPDTTSIPEYQKSDPLLMLQCEGDGLAKVPLWVPANLKTTREVARFRDAQKADAIAEYHRLLYVAMTRAEDELYICGYAGQKKIPDLCWYNTVHHALVGQMSPLADGQGWRLGAPPVKIPDGGVVRAGAVPPVPAWASRRVEFSPSDTGQPPPRRRSEERVARGILIHRILQNLPELDADERLPYVVAAVRRAGADPALADELLALISNPDLSGLFSGDGHSEAALIIDMPGGGVERRRMDRLVVLPDAILVADYKTDRDVPTRPADCPPDYLMQLAIYRDALRLTEPEKPLRFCIVWTETPSLMMIPDELLDRMAALRQPRP
ncbi:double-strand break repair helicase AddA [Aestuariivirga sp.]|uniref:double-strand break repair helicase AddA n=1 Tax=Aestuariivirga sp. TaxID=2650926 RepID=UPI003784A6E0